MGFCSVRPSQPFQMCMGAAGLGGTAGLVAGDSTFSPEGAGESSAFIDYPGVFDSSSPKCISSLIT